MIDSIMLYLGCPIWSSKDWLGNFLPASAGREMLAAYSQRLPMVEGNTTFYGMPSLETVARWRDDAPPGFRFCLKFPRTISHDKALVGCETDLEHWIERLRLLEDRAGPSFLQLSREFGPDRLPVLRRFLESLPPDMRFAVEPRHAGWFTARNEDALNGMLAGMDIARVLYDVRPLNAADTSDPEVREALRKKPQVPVRMDRVGSYVQVRFISHPDVPTNDQWLAEWAPRVAQWLADGADVFFCMHSIYDLEMPVLCRRFHDHLVAAGGPLEPMAPWEEEVDITQLSLF
ncbi:MAG: DUF72 domain-containing protein [Capsulimonas sp.]|uniref:DUF72 domain-containing protein n=1 Tax=Capsulimonas sp. TaxID=2494211 RepID=UPI0032673DA4